MPTIKYRTSDGKRVPGTTTVIGNIGWNRDGLMYWAWKQGSEGKDFREERDAAANAGTVAHAMIEADILGRPADLSGAAPETIRLAEGGYRMFKRWKEMTRLEILDSEICLVSEVHRYGGAIDAIGRVDGQIALLDWKTGNGMYADHLIQLAAYGNLAREHGFVLEGGYHCLRFGKEDGSFHHHHYENLDDAWEAFLLARRLHDMKGPLTRRAQ